MKKHFQLYEEVRNSIQQLKNLKRESQTKLRQSFQVFKNGLYRSLQKTFKKLNNDLSEKFNLIIHKLENKFAEISEDNQNNTSQQNLSALLHRYCKKLKIQSEKISVKDLNDKLQKLSKQINQQLKNFVIVSRQLDTQFCSSYKLQYKRSYPYQQTISSIDMMNGKLFIQGTNFYKFGTREVQKVHNLITFSKIVKIFQGRSEAFLYSTQNHRIKIKDDKYTKILDFSIFNTQDLISIVQIQDLLFFVKKKQIIKFDLHSGEMNIKYFFQQKIETCASKDYLGFLVMIVGKEIRWYNIDLNLMRVKKIVNPIKQIIICEQFIAFNYGDTGIYIQKQYQAYFEDDKISITNACLLNNHQLLLIGKQSYLYTFCSNKLQRFKQQRKQFQKRIVCSISNNYEVYILFENNVIKMFQIQ